MSSPSPRRRAASWRGAGAASRACSRCGSPCWGRRATGGPQSRRRSRRPPPPGSGCSWRAAGRPCAAPRYGGPGRGGRAAAPGALCCVRKGPARPGHGPAPLRAGRRKKGWRKSLCFGRKQKGPCLGKWVCAGRQGVSGGVDLCVESKAKRFNGEGQSSTVLRERCGPKHSCRRWGLRERLSTCENGPGSVSKSH